jgi:hypothetical protein
LPFQGYEKDFEQALRSNYIMMSNNSIQELDVYYRSSVQ